MSQTRTDCHWSERTRSRETNFFRIKRRNWWNRDNSVCVCTRERENKTNECPRTRETVTIITVHTCCHLQFTRYFTLFPLFIRHFSSRLIDQLKNLLTFFAFLFPLTCSVSLSKLHGKEKQIIVRATNFNYITIYIEMYFEWFAICTNYERTREGNNICNDILICICIFFFFFFFFFVKEDSAIPCSFKKIFIDAKLISKLPKILFRWTNARTRDRTAERILVRSCFFFLLSLFLLFLSAI